MSSKAGFLASLDEALLNCGEVALVFEQDGNVMKFMSYTLQRQGDSFEDGDIRNSFLSQTMENKCFEDSDRELWSKYLDACLLSEIGRKQETRSVYKYKPVALKTKPVIEELLGKFRIQREEIVGDLLAEIPKLLVKPPEFELTGRYTLEHKEKIDSCHEGDFLWDEERKLMHHFMMKALLGKIKNKEDFEKISFCQLIFLLYLIGLGF